MGLFKLLGEKCGMPQEPEGKGVEKEGITYTKGLDRWQQLEQDIFLPWHKSWCLLSPTGCHLPALRWDI